MPRTYVTVSLPYVNAAPHLGYALELVHADALARFWRQEGHEVRFHGGTDDHALKNVLASEAAGVPTGAFVASNADRFEALAGPLSVSFDEFIRTSTDRRHRPGVEHLWAASAARGDFYRRTYEGWYCVGCEQFYAEGDLVDGRCAEHIQPAEWVAEENWFFRLSRYQEQLEELIASRRLRIEPDAYRAETLAFIRSGLEDISVSRSSTRARGWGIPVPGDPDQVIYVWWDALANYVTALGHATADPDYRRWWLDADQRIHVIGKDIVRFHAVYWPALLLSAGEPVPTALFVHPFLTVDGQKLSKTTGNVVDPTAVVDAHGEDAVRWWLLAEVPRVADADFTVERLAGVADEDLANGIGNVASRVLTMVQQYRGGCLREINPAPAVPRVGDAYDSYDIASVVRAVRAEIAATNRLVESTRPWELAKRERSGEGDASKKLDEVLAALVARLTLLSQLLVPLLPSTASKLAAMLTTGEDGALPEPTRLRERSA